MCHWLVTMFFICVYTRTVDGRWTEMLKKRACVCFEPWIKTNLLDFFSHNPAASSAACDNRPLKGNVFSTLDTHTERGQGLLFVHCVHFIHTCALLLKDYGYGQKRQNGDVPQEIVCVCVCVCVCGGGGGSVARSSSEMSARQEEENSAVAAFA